MILYGGTDDFDRATFGDTWAYDAETNTWTEVSPPSAPDSRAWHAMAYDLDGERIILFGGGPTRGQFTNEVWAYDPANNTWAPIS